MAQTTTSLWPDDLASISVRTPVTILKEQAAALGKMTKNLIEGRVTVTPFGQIIVVYLDLVVPTLKNYTYRLLRVKHGSLLYPVQVAAHSMPELREATDAVTVAVSMMNAREARNEDEFLAVLREILTSEETKKVLAALLAQAES
jgi:hypothetical protein